MSYEFELRKEACRLCKEQAMGVQAALWTALRNPEHRMKHWLQLVAIPNAPSSSSSSDIQSVAEDRSLTTSACVSLARFAEPIFLSLLKTRWMVPRCLALQFPLR